LYQIFFKTQKRREEIGHYVAIIKVWCKIKTYKLFTMLGY